VTPIQKFKQGDIVTYTDLEDVIRKGTITSTDWVSFRENGMFVYHIRRKWSITEDVIAEDQIVDPSMLDELILM